MIGITVAAMVGIPSAARANDTTCGGYTKLGNSGVASNDVEYVFGCSAPIKSFAIITNTTVNVFGVTARVYDPATNVEVEKQSFDCAGSIPGVGASCVGKANGGTRIRGNLGLNKPACGLARAWLVVSDVTGSVAGPFQLGTPKGCSSKRAKSQRRGKRNRR